MNGSFFLIILRSKKRKQQSLHLFLLFPNRRPPTRTTYKSYAISRKQTQT